MRSSFQVVTPDLRRLRIEAPLLVGSLLLAALGGCAARCHEPTREMDPPESARRPSVTRPSHARPSEVDPTAPLCGEFLELSKPCRLVGVYVLDVFRGVDGSVFDVWPVVYTDNGGLVMLESIWAPERKHEPGTVARFSGRRVEAYGVPHVQPPLPADRQGGNNYAYLPCLSPVVALRLLEDE